MATQAEQNWSQTGTKPGTNMAQYDARALHMIVNYDVSPTNIFGSWLRTEACFENFKIYSLKLAKNAMPVFGYSLGVHRQRPSWGKYEK